MANTATQIYISWLKVELGLSVSTCRQGALFVLLSDILRIIYFDLEAL